MTASLHRGELHNISKSKFLRSIFLQIVLIFLIVIVAIIGITFFSFTSEINKSVFQESQNQLEVICDNISSRMQEVGSIAYNIGEDNTFYLESVEGKYSEYDVTKSLDAYLVGNDFIQYILYYKLSEPDVVYTSVGKLTYEDFLNSFMSFDLCAKEEYMKDIVDCRNTKLLPITSEVNDRSFFTYVCPLPQLTKNPKAYVIILIPISEVKPIFSAQLDGCHGEIAAFDKDNNIVFHLSNTEAEFDQINEDYLNGTYAIDQEKYLVQQVKSDTIGWTFISVIQKKDIISEVANNQLLFIILLFVLMIVAIGVMLLCIIVQYKPINSLAMKIVDKDKNKDVLIDEKSLLSDTFAILKDDSDQKQKFEAAYLAADAANKAKSTFLSNMSHDIRTPMNAIVGMTELAFKHADDTHYVKECLQNVRVSSQYLLDIINNVLDMSRIESGRFTLSQDVVEIPKIICGITTILNQSLSVKSLTLQIDTDDIIDEKIIADNVRLTQVFMNILSNSVKFTPNGGSISVKMSQTKAVDGYADYQFIFKDTGIGMSPEFTKQVFDTFTRDHANVTVNKVEGTGLGMAIAKNFVELMGGTIKCESELGKGTTFTINMHLKLAEDQEQIESYEKYSAMSVLILSENISICEKQAKLFNEFGCKVRYATNIEEAISILKEKEENYTSRFMIINQSLMDKSGIDTIQKVVEKTGMNDISFVLAAKDMLCVEQSSAVDAGMTAFVQVPLFRSTVRRILDKSLELQHTVDLNSIVDLEGKNILLVEDNSINRKIAYSLLSETKANIIEASDGKEAVYAFKNHEEGFFSIILMDVQMPVMNGYEATAAIRSIQRADAKTIPIYAMTANTFDEDVRQVKEAGMNGHLGKPYIPKDLYKILEQAIMEK